MIRILTCVTTLICFNCFILLEAKPSPRVTTDAEADALVEEEMGKKKKAKKEKVRKLKARNVLSSKKVKKGKKTLKINKVKPRKKFRKIVKQQQLVSVNNSIEDLETHIEKMKNRKHHTVMISVTIYDNAFSELRWHHEGEQYRAFSPIDLKIFEGVGSFQLGDNHYTLIMTLGDETIAAARERGKWLPKASDYSGDPTDYIVVEGDHTNENAFASIDALHLYHLSEYEDLAAANTHYRKVKAAKERYLERNPEGEKVTIINYWSSDTQKRRKNK